MMARASGTIPPYTSSIYLPGSIGRYRQYPRVVKTQIPGAGVKAGKLVWGEQMLNLYGASRVPYSVARLPLLGLGQMSGWWQENVTTQQFALGAAAGVLAGGLGMHLLHRFGVMR